MMELCPISLTDAMAFVAQTHRHHKPPQGGLFAVSVAVRVCSASDMSAAALECGASAEDKIVGVAIIGRPVARMLDDGYTAEVTRLATDGEKNACSMLYAAAWRACRALGYRRLITYILDTEPGTSLVAAGWKFIGKAGGGSWSVPSRPRIDKHPLQGKFRFERTLERSPERNPEPSPSTSTTITQTNPAYPTNNAPNIDGRGLEDSKRLKALTAQVVTASAGSDNGLSGETGSSDESTERSLDNKSETGGAK